MDHATDLEEYMAEVRKQVCSHCIERPPGGPPCAPLGKICGIEQHLDKLVDAIRDVHSPLAEPYLEHNRKEICQGCRYLNCSICPCPMDYLNVLLVEAVEAVDARRAEAPWAPVIYKKYGVVCSCGFGGGPFPGGRFLGEG